MLVHKSCNMLQHTGSNIKVYTDVCPRSTDRVVQVSGSITKVLSVIHVPILIIPGHPGSGHSLFYFYIPLADALNLYVLKDNLSVW